MTPITAPKFKVGDKIVWSQDRQKYRIILFIQNGGYTYTVHYYDGTEPVHKPLSMGFSSFEYNARILTPLEEAML